MSRPFNQALRDARRDQRYPVSFAADMYVGRARQPVTVAENGADPFTMGTINGNTFTVSGTWTAANVGTYTQNWYVGGVAITPSLTFTIQP